MIKKIKQLFCKHRWGISIVTIKQYSPGCNLDGGYKYVICTNCGKVLIACNVLEEYDGIQGR